MNPTRRFAAARAVDVLMILMIVGAAIYISVLQARIRLLEKQVDAGGEVVAGMRLLPLEGKSLLGAPLHLERGESRLVIVSTPRCGGCRTAMPYFQQLVARVGTHNVLLLVPLLNGSDLEESRQYFASSGFAKVISMTLDPKQLAELRLLAVPRVLLVDQAGRIVKVWREQPNTEEIVDAWNHHRRDS